MRRATTVRALCASTAACEVVDLADVVDVATGAEHTCAARRDGTVWCWGNEMEGELGRGAPGVSMTPVTVAALP